MKRQPKDNGNPHTFGAGTRLSSVYTLGRRGMPCPPYAAEPTSGARKAWKRGHDEWLKERKS